MCVLKRLYLLVFFPPVLYSQFALVIYLKNRDRGTDVEHKCMATKGKEDVGGWD